jgi:hypothetical protein
MVVISASICNKNGKILMARQFIPITKLKMEEYMANFPKLIESGKYSHIFNWSIEHNHNLTMKIMYTYWDREHKICVSADREIVLGIGYKQEFQHHWRPWSY